LSPTATSTVQNPYNFYSSGGTHTITLIVTNSDGCKDTSAQIITVGIPPAVSATGGSLICKGYYAQLSATGGVTYQWTPTVSLNLPFTANPEATPTISTQYSVVITTSLIVNGLPCQFLLTTNVNVTQPSVIPVGANANPIIVTTGSATTLTYIGDPGAIVNWLPPGSTTPGIGYTVTAYPDRPTTYTAVASYGACKESAQVRVDAYSAGCLDGDVFVPNTFTPNGDGKNDLLFVRGLKVEEIYFAVYNRWGEMVFETNDKTKGWDGIYKGRAADVGVFGWYLKVKCINGEESFKKGNVTLVR
jgi:gliding motility-associated-like protein